MNMNVGSKLRILSEPDTYLDRLARSGSRLAKETGVTCHGLICSRFTDVQGAEEKGGPQPPSSAGARDGRAG